jgi:hypothetical protein
VYFVLPLRPAPYKFVIDFLDLERSATTTKVSESNKIKADMLMMKLQERFKSHVKQQVKQASKQNHWILKFEFKKLPVVAATMVLSNHLKIELRCLSKTACLLAKYSNKFIHSRAFPWREGAYLYIDINRGVFMRSGKVVSCETWLLARQGKHLAAS